MATATATATATVSSSSTTTTIIAAARPTATTTTPPRPQPPQPSSYPIPHPHPPVHHHHHIYAAQNLHIRPQTQTPNSSTQQQGGILYPVASSGRGFIPRPARPQDPTVTVANNNPNLASATYHPRAYRPSAIPSASSRAHPQPAHLMRPHPTHLQHQQHYVGVASATIKGLPVVGQLKVAPTPSPVSDSNGYKNSRDRSRDDTLVLVRDRKVRISDGASLYVLCRSWLRNGFSEDSQAHNGDVIRPLPRPDPVLDTHSPKKDDEMEEDEKVEKSVAHLSTEDLLKRHINRAKKVRARLREERLKRIARYKNRLGLLLPPQVEQFRNDMTAGN